MKYASCYVTEYLMWHMVAIVDSYIADYNGYLVINHNKLMYCTCTRINTCNVSFVYTVLGLTCNHYKPRVTEMYYL